jgi:hypothetical protein
VWLWIASKYPMLTSFFVFFDFIWKSSRRLLQVHSQNSAVHRALTSVVLRSRRDTPRGASLGSSGVHRVSVNLLVFLDVLLFLGVKPNSYHFFRVYQFAKISIIPYKFLSILEANMGLTTPNHLPPEIVFKIVSLSLRYVSHAGILARREGLYSEVNYSTVRLPTSRTDERNPRSHRWKMRFLRTCCLVCRGWLDVCQAFLFQNVYIRRISTFILVSLGFFPSRFSRL